MKSISPREHAAKATRLAAERYAKHELVRATPDRWLIAQSDTVCFATEIVLVGHHRHGHARILVHGDGPNLLCGHSSYSGERLLPWLANLNPDYLVGGKIIAGDTTEWLPEVALDWLHDAICEERRDVADALEGDSDVYDQRRKIADDRIDALESIREHLVRGDYDGRSFRDALYELTEDSEYGESAGKVPAWDVFAAREAARTLLRLLKAREDAT